MKMMMLFSILGVLLMMAGQAGAVPIQIVVDFIETAGGIKAIVYFDGILDSSILPTPLTGESIQVSIPQFDYPASFRYYQDILEPDGITSSDRILWSFGGIGGGTIIQFGSDPDFPDIGAGLGAAVHVDAGDIIEVGTLQAAFGPWESYRADHYLYTNFQSPVPEPATMLLVGSGLLGLAGIRRKLRKK